ncbi:AraC family transcriptional regulator [Actinomadura livida]|uniref:AraC family transcriptional regulator n=1 Tax=Actinomadura livida TaxID=79909 RepID=A0A7W7N278_9ACTN|nr:MULTISPECIES: helix-turn-helix domain-containing protein [Actinomadura]MBB4778717.1 AraC-like DNA-binding protein [Actinomadura catellatispora]GGU36106.1 transcriptional regulator [Actinomadura livida]
MTAPETPPPLSAHQRVASKDIGVLHDTVEPFAVGHDLHAREPDVPLNGLVNAVGVGAVTLVWVRYGGGGVIVDTPPTEGHFAMCAPIAPMGVEYQATKSRDTAGGSLVLSHDEAMRMTPDPLLGCLVIATSTGRLADHLAGQLGRRHTPPLRFHSVDGPAILPSSIVERTWRHVCGVLDHVTAEEEGQLHPLAARNLEESLLTAVLLGLPHTATERLAEAPPRAPHHLAGAIREWIEAHHDRPIGVVDIATAVGIGVRQLQTICQDQWGLTPTQLLRGVRLDHARTALIEARPGPRTVTDVAGAAGYVHMSRFAAHYRQRFGETPTQTLRRSGQLV